jgi:hypothetical protein
MEKWIIIREWRRNWRSPLKLWSIPGVIDP